MTGTLAGWAFPVPHHNISGRLRGAIATVTHSITQWRAPSVPTHRLTIFEDAVMEREMYRL